MMVLLRTPAAQGEGGVLSVSDLTALIMERLEDGQLQEIWVQGEITGFKQHSSGHLYFSLGDRESVVGCIVWKSDARTIPFSPGDGIHVFAFGTIGVYPKNGQYRFYVREMRLAGEGERFLCVEAWKRELEREGLFAAERKRPLPLFPVRIAVVTSVTGAVIHDILTILSRRYPLEVVLSPTAVQGTDAHRDIADAIRRVDGTADVIIVGRGGGSYEDLFPFNHPDVVRAIACCGTPVITAIGHEVDTTLADLAADRRAPTPSAAAELAVPDRAELLQHIIAEHAAMDQILGGKLERAWRELEDARLLLQPRRITRRLNERRGDIADLTERLRRSMDLRLEQARAHQGLMEQALRRRVQVCRLEMQGTWERACTGILRRRQRELRTGIEEQRERLSRAMAQELGREKVLLHALHARLSALDPMAPMRRGYSLTLRDGEPVTSVRQLTRGDRIVVRLRDGTTRADVTEVDYAENV
jgi:exodeoxyribonuclease VII large subunit